MEKPELAVGEQELATWKVGWRHNGAWVSGYLVLTNERVLFYPRGLARIGWKPWALDLEWITDVTIGPRGGTGWEGGGRRKLQIERGETKQRFVLKNLDSVVATIQAAVAAA